MDSRRDAVAVLPQTIDMAGLLELLASNTPACRRSPITCQRLVSNLKSGISPPINHIARDTAAHCDLSLVMKNGV
jgi:hypothetical protein